MLTSTIDSFISATAGWSGTSSIFSLTGPSPTGNRQRGTHIANINPDEWLMCLVDPRIKIKDLMGNDPMDTKLASPTYYAKAAGPPVAVPIYTVTP